MTAANDLRVFPGRTRHMKNKDKVEFFVRTSTSGAIDTALSWLEADQGGTIELTGSEDGRYTVTVWKGYKGIRSWGAGILAADDTVLTTAKGIIPSIRDIDIGAGAADGTVELQWSKNTDLADADVEDGLAFFFWMELERP